MSVRVTVACRDAAETPPEPPRNAPAVRVAVAALVAAALAAGWGAGTADDQAGGPSARKRPDVVFVPTPGVVVDKMLELADLRAGDVVYDLGCGDGRIVVAAASRYGVRAVGFDVDPKRVAEARENVRRAGVEGLVTIEQRDLFAADLSGASVVTLYLLPGLNARLKTRLAQLKPGSRIVSHAFGIAGARPKKSVKVPRPRGAVSTVYLWVVPWEDE